ncbi:glycosyltransferase family 2 protein [Chlorogloeopsis sp. ULAP01]|uniref:glycosyltransferase n=1 Tax=Chlorogloeopsis sp. ULAP01 TaxID=3056483 RepID=UPI0025AAE0E0|nr:glycosyltransferase family 2 protein [Chlorogloeopsis sp. ULAP01]MDM9382079.1 glycosyltransferase family 2 protein [Chlorogloeopsis sp. ULAP01]
MSSLNSHNKDRLINDKYSPLVSVIIPVFNDAQRLQICLEALENQTYPKHLYKVIVVDNGSDPDEDIEGVVAKFGQAIATSESLPGSYAARNKGISLVQGDVIAFTDADCIPAQDWIEKGVKHLLETPNCGLVAGKIETIFKDKEQATPVELFESITAFPQKQLLEERHYGATANVFTFKSVLDRVGIFDARLKSHGDVNWGRRVFAYGYKQVYADDTCVAHPARYSFTELYKRTIRLAGGFYDLQIRSEPSVFKQNLIFCKNLIKHLIPPLMWVYTALIDKRLNTIEDKMKVSLVMFFVRYVYAKEIIMLKLGSNSARE